MGFLDIRAGKDGQAKSGRWWGFFCGLAVVAGLTTNELAQPAPSSASDGVDSSNCATTAGDAQGWGTPVRSDDFDDPGMAGWKLYRGIGHRGNGMRTPDALSVSDSMMTITGDPQGNTEGIAWMPGQLYGRWEICMRTPPGSKNYHPVVLLWPDSEVWPGDGEIDFVEIFDPTRQVVTASVLHTLPGDELAGSDENDHASIPIDATSWHAWAVEWTPERITGFVDGATWFEVTRHIPTTPMHLCIQLDDFGGDISEGGALIADWVRQYQPTSDRQPLPDGLPPA